MGIRSLLAAALIEHVDRTGEKADLQRDIL
jgi:hypothetical protein